MEMPIGSTSTGGRGRILEVQPTQINPGRAADALAEAAEILRVPRAERGPERPPHPDDVWGMATGLTALIFEHEDMRAEARVGLEAWMSDEGLALQAKSMSATPATTRVSSALYTEVPI